MTMPRACIFCGGPLRDKTDEHALPSWLLELTGDPKRSVHLSTHYDFDERSVSHRQFAFSNFVFPACADCNHAYGNLEGAAKEVVSKLLGAEAVTGADIHVLMDWLDKVRIGLWLGELQLGGNPLQIKPNFHISQRVGRKDRAVFISRIGPGAALTVMGTRVPAFTYFPSVFGMRINDLILFNVSTDHLFGDRIGFPYPKRRTRIKDSVRMKLEMEKGLGRIKLPLIQHGYTFPSVKFFQPMFSDHVSYPNLRPLYDYPYVKERCWDWANGVGKVFFLKGDKLLPFEGDTSLDYPRCEIWDRPKIGEDFQITILDWQIFMMRFMPSHHHLDKAESKAVSQQHQFAVRFNKDLIKAIRSGKGVE